MKHLKLLLAASLCLFVACQDELSVETSPVAVNSKLVEQTITPEDAATLALEFRDNIYRHVYPIQLE